MFSSFVRRRLFGRGAPSQRAFASSAPHVATRYGGAWLCSVVGAVTAVLVGGVSSLAENATTSSSTTSATSSSSTSSSPSSSSSSSLSSLPTLPSSSFANALSSAASSGSGSDEHSPKAQQQRVQAEMERDSKERAGPPVYRIVLTGGPCGGKSTALATISDRLLSLGFRVLRVPEAATIVITGAAPNFGAMEVEERRVFEASIIKAKIALEDIFYDVARSGRTPSVIICDRGTMDSVAYMSDESWDIMLDDQGWNVVELRDKRYDAVIHMVTAAIGAEQFYTTDNNAARSEGLAAARELDFKVLNAWVGHPHIRIVDNSSDFKRKIVRVEEIICQIIGAPRPVTAERKYLVAAAVDLLSAEVQAKVGVKVETFVVEQTYLRSTNAQTSEGYNYLRRRGQNGTYTYTHSMVRASRASTSAEGPKGGEHVILERAISGREYVALLKSADPQRLSVKKKVQCFLWNGEYYELQTFVHPDIALSILKTEPDTNSATQGQQQTFPWFLSVQGEITGLKEFSSFFLAEHYNGIAPSPGQAPLRWQDNAALIAAYDKAQKGKAHE